MMDRSIKIDAMPIEYTLSLIGRELEHCDIITRTEYPQVPPKVEYCLTQRGLSLMPILSEMCNWGKINLNSIDKNSKENLEKTELYGIGRWHYINHVKEDS